MLMGLCSVSLAQAHIVLDVQSAVAGSFYRGAFRVGHGCDGSPVTQVIVTIPEGVQGAKPMPKAGWNIDIQRKSMTPDTKQSHQMTEDVSQIRWTAKTPADALPNEYFDEFVVFAKLPDTPGKLYWKTSQICEQGQIDWDQIPTGDARIHLKNPAPVLEVIAKPATDAQQGMDMKDMKM
jgi:uncharacterized protein YcnI